jgi:glycosyltransferase involved in cell wall biosynthesis
VSEYVAHDFRRHIGQEIDRLEVIPPGINFDRFDPAVVRADRVIKLAHELRVPDGAHVVVCPTRFTEDSGQKTLIHAIKLLDRGEVFCLLLGSGGKPTAFEKELEREIEANGLNGRVQIGPHLADMPAAYMLADVVISLGGARQGFSRIILEAQAMGRPVVCEQGGGAAEAVVDGLTGWLAREADPAALAQAIRSALALSGERRADLARAAQNNTRIHYGLGRSNDLQMKLYERLLA